MAESKRSFILYADLLHTVEKMPKEKAGELFMTILEYVNDKNPEPDDLLTSLVFEPIKQQLKRDLNRWESIKDKRSEAGKASAEARKLAKLIEQNSTNSTSVKNDEQTSTNSTVNVNDTVNGNVTVSDIKKEYIVGQSSTSPTETKLNDKDKCQLFVQAFNKKKMNGDKPSEYQSIPKVCSALRQRLKKYTSKQLLFVVDQALNDTLIENRFITPEYVLRENTIERYINSYKEEEVKKSKNYVP